jgi:ATP-binding cassette, subfamily B, bacterial
MTHRTAQLSIRRGTLSLIRAQPGIFLLAMLGGIFFFGTRLVPGWIEKLAFDYLTLGEAAIGPRLSLGTLVGLLLAVEVVRSLVDYGGKMSETMMRKRGGSLMRANVVRNVLRRPGALPLPVPPGDAVIRLGDDVNDFADFPTWLPYLAGEGLFTLAALTILFQIAPQVTLVALLPLVGVLLLNRVAFRRMLYYSRESRQAAGEVGAFLGEILGAVQAVKVADAGDGVLGYFRVLNEARRRTSVRDSVFGALFHALSANMGDIAVALMVVLIGGALARREISVGDFVLFSGYLFFAAQFPAMIGGYLSEIAQQRAVLDRLQALQPEAPPQSLVANRESDGTSWDSNATAVLPVAAKGPVAADRPLLAVRGLTCRFAGGGGIAGVDLELAPGSLTVVTGRVGAGKTTLLRALLGLLPRESGEFFWLGEPVDDPAGFLVPPRSAYTPQVPRLFSETLRENILLGVPAGEAALWAAVEAAVLAPDVVRLEQGLETVVGPRGVRLSGGQVQRAAAARMLVRRPALLVMDDLSSALDVETEQQLWVNLAAAQTGEAPVTMLVVSHRREALRRAGQIVMLANGQVTARGSLVELLASSPEIQALWRGGYRQEAQQGGAEPDEAG